MFSTTIACTVAPMRAHRHLLLWPHPNRKQKRRARPRNPQSQKREVPDRRSASRSNLIQRRKTRTRTWPMPKLARKRKTTLLWCSARKQMRKRVGSLVSHPPPGSASLSHWRTIKNSWRPFSVHGMSTRSSCDKTLRTTFFQSWRNAPSHYGKNSWLSSASSKTNRRWSAQRDPAASQSRRIERRKSARLVRLRRRSSATSRWHMKNRKGYAEQKRYVATTPSACFQAKLISRRVTNPAG